MCVLPSGPLNLLTLYLVPILMTSTHQITNKVSPLIFLKNENSESMEVCQIGMVIQKEFHNFRIFIFRNG